MFRSPEVRAERYSGNAAIRCEESLGEFSWVTVCPAALAVKLGGADGLRRTNAFHEVAEVKGGGLFLMATPTLDGYDQGAMERVRLALGPVLAEGDERR